MSFEWTELSYQQDRRATRRSFVFPLCVLFVFLVLAAQYESLTLPLAIILIVPMCLLAPSPACCLVTATTTSSPRSA